LLAARLVAEDQLSDVKIAAKVGIERRQLTRWRQHPEFAAKVNALIAAMGERSMRFAVARKHRRVKAMNERWRKLKQIMRERAAAPDMAGVPGGKTGLLVRKVKSIGTGKHAREIEEFEVDTGLLKEIRDLEREVALELGQRDAKGDDRPNINLNIEGSVNVLAVKQFASLSLADRLRLGLQAGGVPAEGGGGGPGGNGEGDPPVPG
jgi:hypothetical protein